SLVEKNGGEVVLVTLGQEDALESLRSALAMGAHRAILVKTQGRFQDSGATAKALKAAMDKDGAGDLVFTGKGAVDTEGFQTPYRLARALGVPVVNEVTGLDITEGRALAQVDLGGGERGTMEMALPAVIGATKGLNQPRYPKFPDIMKAKKKKVDEMELADLGLDGGQAAVLEKLELVPERQGARMLEGDVDAQVTELVNILKTQEKVI
ncbi:MAG: electron transfer flavoprotein subunit beta/FixA family protein, partial [Desulfobacterales bacterium]|nr:electron transfer flavoprotein subunit beta/FixA family protein [Desulfobacterales bacterium]